MTGKDLIIYILSNHLEDEEIFKDGKFVGFMTVLEAAAKYNVGTATIQAWINKDMLTAIQIGDVYYIPYNAEPKLSGVQISMYELLENKSITNI